MYSNAGHLGVYGVYDPVTHEQLDYPVPAGLAWNPIKAIGGAIGKVGGAVVGVGKKVVRSVPGAVTGFIAGGPAGAIAGGGASFIGQFTSSAPTGSGIMESQPSGGLNVGNIFQQAAQAALERARAEAQRQIAPVVEPFAREALLTRTRERVAGAAPILIPAAILGAALLMRR